MMGGTKRREISMFRFPGGTVRALFALTVSHDSCSASRHGQGKQRPDRATQHFGGKDFFKHAQAPVGGGGIIFGERVDHR